MEPITPRTLMHKVCVATAASVLPDSVSAVGNARGKQAAWRQVITKRERRTTGQVSEGARKWSREPRGNVSAEAALSNGQA
jgi:hypothetical protein